jgi:hypothetical protein
VGFLNLLIKFPLFVPLKRFFELNRAQIWTRKQILATIHTAFVEVDRLEISLLSLWLEISTISSDPGHCFYIDIACSSAFTTSAHLQLFGQNFFEEIFVVDGDFLVFAESTLRGEAICYANFILEHVIV